jgi:hypothetical protein
VIALSFGGGVNSTALLLQCVRKLMTPTLVLWADTGGELPETYEHVERVRAFCGLHGIDWATVTNAGRGQGDSLEANCLQRKELPSLAYGFKGCSAKWKRQPMDRYLRTYPAAVATWERGAKVGRLIGIDAGEAHRSAPPNDARYWYDRPLVNWGWDREMCERAIREHGWPVPPKSSCFFCPAMRVSEILQLGEKHPQLLQRALDLEANAVTTSVQGLGRRFAWADVVNQDSRQARLPFADTTPAPPCGCYDEASDE